MKTRLILAVLMSVTILTMSPLAGADELPKALGVTFGAPIENVKMLYKAKGLDPQKENASGLIYFEPLVSVDGVYGLFYKPFQDKLMQTKVLFDTETMDSSASKLTTRYYSLEKMIGKKYGKPESRIDGYGDSTYNTNEYRLLGIKTGKVKYFTKWETEDLQILLSLYGDNHKITFILNYYYLPLFNQWKEEQEKTKESAF